MLCSARELGLGTDHDGILALTVNVAPGTPFLDAVPTGDVRYEIDVLPNRPDLLCQLGLARELSALTKLPLQTPPELAQIAAPSGVTIGARELKHSGVSVRIDDLDSCPRYMAVVIRGVKVGPSPAWLQDRLTSVGVRSISNVVDVTNYFLHGFGQPMHVFDLGKLSGSSIVVRRAKPGEKLVTLDGVDRALTPDMLVIADADRAAAVAGVIGGRESEVTDATTDIVLEVANFEPRTVRRTRRALGLNTDASHRFERGTDPAEVQRAGMLAAGLIAQLGGGRVDGGPLFVGALAPSRAKVNVNPERVTRLLGAQVTAGEIRSLLTGIGFEVESGTGVLTVTPPSWRHDVARDVDLIEEVARLRGYDTLSDTLAPFRPSAAPDHPLHGAARRVRDALTAAGFSEVRPLPFVRGDERTHGATHVRVTNPLANDEPYLRSSILETLVPRAEYNLARREGNLRLFEIGSAFARNAGTVREECRVGVLLMGARRPVHFTEPSPPPFDAWDAKGVALTVATAAFPGQTTTLNDGAGDALWAIAVDGAVAGLVRAVALDAPPWAEAAFGVELTIGTLSLDPVAKPAANAHGSMALLTADAMPVRYRALPTMPAADFDLAFIVPNGLESARIEDVLRRAGGDMLERVALFDEYHGAGLPEGHRSLAWRLTFRAPDRTLNDKEIAGRRQKLIAAVKKEHNVDARTS
jgi:phenylalanyl-tRNA synthetase beta chain